MMAALLGMLPCSSLSADLVRVDFDNPANQISAGATTNFDFSLSNNTDTDTAEDLLAGYQLTIRLVAEAGSQGRLEFLTPATERTSYIFPSNSGITTMLLTTITSDDTARVSDALFPFSGTRVQVPTTGVNTFSIPVKASSDALGDFSLIIVNQLGGRLSEWTDSASPNQLARRFAGLDLGGSFELGQFEVVPEPSAFCFCSVTLAVALAIYCLSKRVQIS